MVGKALVSLEGPYTAFKGNIRGYFKAILKAMLGNFELVWPFSWLSLLSGPVKQRPLKGLIKPFKEFKGLLRPILGFCKRQFLGILGLWRCIKASNGY